MRRVEQYKYSADVVTICLVAFIVAVFVTVLMQCGALPQNPYGYGVR